LVMPVKFSFGAGVHAAVSLRLFVAESPHRD